jgi:hypothetical protein
VRDGLRDDELALAGSLELNKALHGARLETFQRYAVLR